MTTPHAAPLDPIWAWFGARRAGTRYQPLALAADTPDPNGCIPKLAHLRHAAFEIADSRVIGVGCSSGYYEAALAAAAVTRVGRGAAHVTLVDTDRCALDDAVIDLAAPRAAGTTVFHGAAEHFAWTERFDLCVFLSLYHHYDRLGDDARALGDTVLAQIGRHCQAMLFETGQSDDEVAGADVWRHRIAMNSWPSPRAWLAQEVPRLTGFSRCRFLGTNPTTRRHVQIFWHASVTMATGHFGRVQDLATPAAVHRHDDVRTLWRIADALPVSHGVSESHGLDDVPGAFAAHARPGDHLVSAELRVIRALAPSLPIVLHLAECAPDVASHTLASAAYAGCSGVTTTHGTELPSDCAMLAAELGVPYVTLPLRTDR